MRIHSTSLVRHPRTRVYSAYRDELPEVVNYIPDVEYVEVLKRENLDDRVRLHNEWKSSKSIPAFARKVIRPEMLCWDDYAEWIQERWACEWVIKLRAFTQAVTCAGTNHFVAEGENQTRVIIEGSLDMDLRRVPGVPRMVAGPLAPRVEAFIVSLITPNLERVNGGLGDYLDEKFGG